jgi:hypothetical protein
MMLGIRDWIYFANHLIKVNLGAEGSFHDNPSQVQTDRVYESHQIFPDNGDKTTGGGVLSPGAIML